MNTQSIFTTLAILTAIIFKAQGQEPFKLTVLPYSYEALEPYIDAQTMEIHHSRHHAAYVNNLNAAIKGTPAETLSLEELMANISKYDVKVRNNGGGHYNHDLFWSVLSPEAGGEPKGELARAIKDAFGSFSEFQKLMNTAGANRFGSGWSWLYVNNDGKLAVGSTPNQDNPLMDIAEIQGTPILGIDVWEHAYYLKYQNKRGDYLNAIWNVIDWDAVSRRYLNAIGN